MRTRLMAGLILVVLAQTAGSWQWPVAEAELVSTFGQTRDGLYSRGITFSGSASEVYAAEAGIVVFLRDSGAFPAGLGTTIVVEHARGLRTVYGNLQANPPVAPGDRVDPSVSLGVMGTTGRATGPSLYFAVFDTTAGKWVNPMLLLPELPDSVSPVIQSLFLQGDGALFEVRNGGSVPPGSYALLIDCPDRFSPGGESVAPYSVEVFVDGFQVISVVHNELVLADGVLQLAPGPEAGHRDMRTGSGEYRVAEVDIVPGETRLEVIVSDFSGGTDSIDWGIVGQQ